MDEQEARTQMELTAIIGVLTDLTGLASRWSGRVELVANADFKGKKRFSCDIQIDTALTSQEARWTTLIHEGLHSLSIGYVRNDYQDFQGWEEGVVEKLQRLFRPRILPRIGIADDPRTFQLLDAQHAYNNFIVALDTLLAALSVPEERVEAFYIELLSTPIKDRKSHVARRGFLLPSTQRTEFFAALSVASATLRTRR